MAASKCFSLVRGRAIRVTRLDGCGAVVLGPDSQVVSDGFITVGFTATIDEGTAISVTNAAGAVCILDEPCPKFTGYDVTVEFCGVNPALIELMTGQISELSASATPENVGFRMNSGIDACDSGFAMELWSQVPAAVCEEGTTATYGYILVPFLKGGVIGDFTVGNDAVNFTLSGAKSKDGSAWGTGPYNVIAGPTGAPSKLTKAIDPKDHLLVRMTSIAPPEVDCDAAGLGTEATSAVAGSPGTYTPANAYGPADLADAVGLTASPNTAWENDEYITLRDGSTATWSGSAWVDAGVSPMMMSAQPQDETPQDEEDQEPTP